MRRDFFCVAVIGPAGGWTIKATLKSTVLMLERRARRIRHARMPVERIRPTHLRSRQPQGREMRETKGVGSGGGGAGSLGPWPQSTCRTSRPMTPHFFSASCTGRPAKWMMI